MSRSCQQSCLLLVKAGLDVRVESGAGVRAGFPDSGYASQGARLMPDRRQLYSEVELLFQVHGPGATPRDTRGGAEPVAPRPVCAGVVQPPRCARKRSRPGRKGHHRLCPGAPSAHQSGAADGCPERHGDGGRLQSGPPRCKRARQDVSHDDHRCRHHHPGPGVRRRGRRGRAAGDRGIAPTGSGRARIRRPAGGQRAGREPGRQVRGDGARDGDYRGRLRVCQGDGRRVLSTPERSS